MPYYAKVINGIVRGITQTAAPVTGPGLVEIESYDTSIMGYLYANGQFTPPASSAVLTPKDFWQRFTSAEREALQNLIATGTQTQKNKLNAFRDYILIGGNVELDDDYIIASVQLMRAANVIGVGRDNEILS